MRDLEAAVRLADAVLYERRPLHPGRAGEAQAPVHRAYVPPGFTATGEPSAAQTECLLDHGSGGAETVHVRSRFLHLQVRTSEGGAPRDEAAGREIDVAWRLADLLDGERVHDTRVPGGCETIDGLTSAWQPLGVRLRASAERLPGPYGVVRLRFRLENTSEWTGERRAEALRRSLLAAHTFLAVTGGSFISPADPPEWARPAAEGCENLCTWPVLIDDDLVLSSPIPLEDRPGTASHDASAGPETGRVTVGGREVGRGSKVRLRPAGRADGQDMLMAGRVATVEAVLSGVDGSRHLAVTIDDDPGAALRREQGRFWYFAPADVEPL